MDDHGKISHIFKLVGIILILLAFTVFARADTYTFDCDDPFNCSIKSYCQDVPGAFPGLLVHNGTALSYDLGNQPINYSFDAISTGEQICEAKVIVSAMHDQGQANEKTQIYINGISMGTTTDNYCNDPEGGDCVFCGKDTQSLGQKTITLQEVNILKVYGYDSHAVVGVVVDCVGGKNCSANLDPIIDNIEDKTISYNTGYFRIDLWDKITDHTDPFSDLNIDVSVSGSTIDCILQNERYLECQAGNTLGISTVTIDVIDDCEAIATYSFNVDVTNQPPHISVPDQTKSCSADLNQFIDLRYYGWDEQIDDVNLEIITQSNTALLNCQVENNYYLTCEVNACEEDYSNITLKITDIFGEYYEDTFKITLANQAPYWIEDIDEECFSEDEYKFVDLRDYAYDIEDKNSLDFTLTQSNKDAIDCYLDDDYYISCEGVSNQSASNTLTIIAEDSKGLMAETQVTIGTNCNGNFDFNSNKKAICLEDCTSYTSEINLKNKSGEKKCFNLDVESNREPFNVSLNKESFCLNDNETTTLYLSANTCDTDYSSYEVKVSDEDNNLSLYFDYSIGTCNNFDGFRIREYDGKICQGEKRTYSVEVKNTTDETKTISLLAENPQILPYFLKEKVTIEDGDTKVVDLMINAKYAALGHYSILLGGDSTNYHIEKHLDLEVVDCSEIRDRHFIISAPEICYDVTRGQTFEGSFNVEHLHANCNECSWNTKGILLSMIGMPNEFSYNALEMRCNEEKKVEYTIYVPKTAKAGTHFVTIVGEEQPDAPFDTEIGFVEPEEVCLNVLGESNSNILLRTQAKDILWCDTEIFELELTNTGDFDESFSLTYADVPLGVKVFFSENTVTVPKKDSKVIYVSVSTDPDSRIADNQYITVNLDGNIPLSTKIYFNIKEKYAFEDIEFVSSTDVLTMKTNEEAKYALVLRNNTEKTLNNISIDIENLPIDANSQELIIAELKSGESITLEGKIISGEMDGTFYPIFVIFDGSVKNKEKFTLVIEKSEESAGLAAFSGLFGLSGLFAFGEISLVVGLAVFLILLLLVIILGLVALSKSHRKEEWLGVERI